jgi:hypothetical protein
MPQSECDHCGGTLSWSWTEAFEKFGFGDGDGQVETWQVETILAGAGYEVTVEGWGMHNTVITSIKKNGTEFIPLGDPDVTFGYDDPRGYLPSVIVELLDKALPDP